MENLLEIALKPQTIFGGIHFLLFLFSWPFVIGYLKDYQENSQFNCLPKPIDYIRQRCYEHYVSSVSPLLTPLDFAGITFGVLGFSWVCFIIPGAVLMQRRRRIVGERDGRRTRKFLLAFTCHVCFQFVVLVVMLGLFCGYQTLEFPAEYSCTQGNITLSPTSQVLASNMTCNDSQYKEKSKLNIGIIVIMSVSIFFCLLTMLHLWIKKKVFLGQLIGNINAQDEEQSVDADAVIEYSRIFKESVKSNTEFQPQLLNRADFFKEKVDEVFTNLQIQHGRKPIEGKTNAERKTFLRDYGQVTGTRVERNEEIFFRKNDNEKIPKSILVTGKAGIGKSMFCQKVIRDWAFDRLFHSATNVEAPEFKFAYLMLFRQLDLLWESNISLGELLNRCSILDERSLPGECLLEYILTHSEEVLIIVDGFDQYSQQDYITSDAHESYPNSAQDKMPVAALCAKLMTRKILGNATVIITSRPDESDKLSGFDRVVEITGFSPKEVEQYIAKYFRDENETMKNTVLDHVMKNEELVSCAHIPVLCALMCSYMKYVLTEPNNAHLPVSTSDLYCRVLKIFESNHNRSKSSGSDKTSLIDKLSKFAADLLKENEFLFGEERLKNFTSEEVEFLRRCGLLHCGPPFRVAFSETTRHFCFTHLTVQEYLAACWFVKTREVPEKGTVSTMVLQFIAGQIQPKERSKRDLMGKLLKVLPSSVRSGNQYLLEAKCLNEHRDLEFATDFYHQHPVLENEIQFHFISNLDSIAISFWLDAISAVNVNRASTRYQSIHSCRSLRIIQPNLTHSGVQRICKALENDCCPITELSLSGFKLNDDWLSSVIGLVRCKLSSLDLQFTFITDDGVSSLCEALQNSDCKVTKLVLSGNEITDVGVARLSATLQHSECKVTKLYLLGDQITDVGVASLSEALQHSECKVTNLFLKGKQITDFVFVANLSAALQHSDCNVNSLYLWGDQITDVGVASLSKALLHSNCKVTELMLWGEKITDAVVDRLSKALQHSDCKVTSLQMWGDRITDVGVARLSKALLHSNCKVTKLHLRGYQITDVGVDRLSEALQHSHCNVTKLLLEGDQITDVGVSSLSKALQHSDCRVTELDLAGDRITDFGVARLNRALRHSNCKVTKLDLRGDCITDVGVDSLSKALRCPGCKVTKLLLKGKQITDVGVASLSKRLQHPDCKVSELWLNDKQIKPCGRATQTTGSTGSTGSC